MTKPKSPYPNNKEVREWAEKYYGYTAKRGRLPKRIIEAWDRRHPKRKYVESEAYHGTANGYTNHDCREDCCRLAFYEVMGQMATKEEATLAA